MSDPNPLVSIAMPFHNGERTLAAAVQSLAVQTWTSWELLLCDDGSTDGSLAIAQDLRDHRIRLWSDGGRKGLAARLNECIDRARGPYIARMDADDIAFPERLEHQVRFLEQHPGIDLVGCSMLIFDERGRALGKRVLPCEHAGIVAHPAVAFGIGHPTWLGRASWFRHYRYDPLAVRCEDADLLWRAHRESCFANLPEVLYGYREPGGGLAKRLRTRVERVRAMRRSHPVCAAAAALLEAAKALLDTATVATGLRYAALRLRERSLSAPEQQQWRDLASLLTDPDRRQSQWTAH